MLAFVIRRVLWAVPILLIGLTVTFFIIHLIPGDPLLRFANPNFPVELQENLRTNFGLDRSVTAQYLAWLNRVIFHFDFGVSFQNGRAAGAIVWQAIPATVTVGGLALIIGLAFGIGIGIIAARNQNHWIDRILTNTALVFYSIPVFVLGLWLVNIFAVNLHWFPTAQLKSLYYDQLSLAGKFQDRLVHFVLPVLTLAVIQTATYARYIRDGLIEIYQSEYIKAAYARGLSRARILVRHALPNSLSPVISMVGMTLPLIFSGMVLIEVIYSIPGMGRVMVEAVMARDYPVILAAVSLAFTAVLIGNLLADILYAILDPRVRLEQ